MNYGLLVIYIIAIAGLLISANQHGKEKKGKYNFFTNLIALILNLLLIWWALGWQVIP